MSFRDLPIRRKLALLILNASVFAVVLACIGIAIYERQNFRASPVNELPRWRIPLARIPLRLWPLTIRRLHGNTGALRAEHNVLGACLYDNRGNIFAEYRQAGLGREFEMPASRRMEPNSGDIPSPCSAAFYWRLTKPAPSRSCRI